VVAVAAAALAAIRPTLTNLALTGTEPVGNPTSEPGRPPPRIPVHGGPSHRAAACHGRSGCRRIRFFRRVLCSTNGLRR
jgi:hypothetical protein